MFRRSFIEALSASTAIPMDTQFTMSQDNNLLLDDLNLIEKDKDWIHRELQNHYGSRQWHRRPAQGIFHQHTDTVWRLPDSRRAILQRAKILTDLPEPYVNENEYDCEDFAFRLYTALTMTYPELSVGVAINNSEGHVWNVFLTSEGEVIDFEPQLGQDVSDSNIDDYDFDNGILIF
jgi:hypothetical protein